ncbi:MAG: hypothetical protein IMW89_20650, partial [Ktedonobacteraceae bacterium]|nr:hypothetical protein [Ktedonobacteraceae bacterium]
MNPFLDKNLARARQQELLQEAEARRKAVLARKQRRGDCSLPQHLFALAETSEEALPLEDAYEGVKIFMKTVPIISLVARLALMAALVLGLLFWIIQIPPISMALNGAILISLRSIHLALGLLGATGFLVLAIVALFTNRTRWLGVGGIIYACILSVFGLTQSLILVGSLHWIIQIAHLLVGIGAMY